MINRRGREDVIYTGVAIEVETVTAQDPSCPRVRMHEPRTRYKSYIARTRHHMCARTHIAMP